MLRKNLIAHRGNKSLTTVASDIGITRQMLGMIESGKRNPSLTLAQKLSAYYEVPIEQLFFDQSSNDMKLNYMPTGTEE